ncbi:hypothetical protein C8R43DRAFT_1125201 [Mycena crocata]|nr:hypothetical protein C8R43DRAFT_1125201 [Mycena crocata]
MQVSGSEPTRPITVFISGPLEATPTYFAEHYARRIDAAISQNHSFVLGTARGIATLARAYLPQQNDSPSRVTTFLSEAEAQVPEWRQFADTLRKLGLGVVVAGRGPPERDAGYGVATTPSRSLRLSRARWRRPQRTLQSTTRGALTPPSHRMHTDRDAASD